jgi:hypothetical protein
MEHSIVKYFKCGILPIIFLETRALKNLSLSGRQVFNWQILQHKPIITQFNNPHQIARNLLKNSVSNDLRLKNQWFVTRCREGLQRHPIAEYSMIQALNRGYFGLDAMQKIQLDYHHGIVQIFTDALLTAEFQSRQLDLKLPPKTKMYTRFLLNLINLALTL